VVRESKILVTEQIEDLRGPKEPPALLKITKIAERFSNDLAALQWVLASAAVV
jgi:hypothetical protein